MERYKSCEVDGEPVDRGRSGRGAKPATDLCTIR
jgi:hypothetical protein